MNFEYDKGINMHWEEYLSRIAAEICNSTDCLCRTDFDESLKTISAFMHHSYFHLLIFILKDAKHRKSLISRSQCKYDAIKVRYK